MNEFARSLVTAWHRNGDYAHQLTADITDEQMIVQPAAGMNHPAWIFSHLNAYHPVLISLLSGQAFDDPRDHPFGMQSTPRPDRDAYAPKSELLATFAAGHQRVAELLATTDDSAFARPMTLERWKVPFPTVGAALGYLMLAHEATHLGQLSAWRRVQGLPPV